MLALGRAAEPPYGPSNSAALLKAFNNPLPSSPSQSQPDHLNGRNDISPNGTSAILQPARTDTPSLVGGQLGPGLQSTANGDSPTNSTRHLLSVNSPSPPRINGLEASSPSFQPVAPVAQIGPNSQVTSDNEKVYLLVAELCSPTTREGALLELSKKREQWDDLALVLWHSFGESACARN